MVTHRKIGYIEASHSSSYTAKAKYFKSQTDKLKFARNMQKQHRLVAVGNDYVEYAPIGYLGYKHGAYRPFNGMFQD